MTLGNTPPINKRDCTYRYYLQPRSLIRINFKIYSIFLLRLVRRFLFQTNVD